MKKVFKRKPTVSFIVYPTDMKRLKWLAKLGKVTLATMARALFLSNLYARDFVETKSGKLDKEWTRRK